MSTLKEVESLLRKAKKELREVKTHNNFLLERLEKAHERNHELRKEIENMTVDDVMAKLKARAEHDARIKRDKQLLETFEKQKEVVLNGNLSR